MGRPWRSNKYKEEETPKSKGKQKRKVDEVMDSSHSDSTTNLNNQSESWECPLSSRKHLTPDSMMISSRRASLRSAKRLTETGTTSLSRCSRPQKSRQHSSATRVIQQPDDPVDTVISAYQVPEGSLVESPSRYLIQVAHPSTLTPEKSHEVTEKVGNSFAPVNFTARVPEMEEEREAEKSLPNHSNQMEGLNTFEVEGISLEQEPLTEDIQASNNFEERANENHSKSFPMVGHPSPSYSLKLTEMVNMWDGEEDDEVNSDTRSSPIDTVDGYKVKPESMPILRKILSKHGDIAKNCEALTMKYRSMLLEMICDIISEMQEKDFGKIKEDVLHDKIALVNEIKNMKVGIEWLHMRLVEILEARQILKQSGMLKEKKESNKKAIEIVERELEECEAQKKEVAERFRSICDRETVCNETLARAKDESTRIASTIKYAKSKVRRFLNCSLADGLL